MTEPRWKTSTDGPRLLPIIAIMAVRSPVTKPAMRCATHRRIRSTRRAIRDAVMAGCDCAGYVACWCGSHQRAESEISGAPHPEKRMALVQTRPPKSRLRRFSHIMPHLNIGYTRRPISVPAFYRQVQLQLFHSGMFGCSIQFAASRAWIDRSIDVHCWRTLKGIILEGDTASGMIGQVSATKSAM